MYKKSADAAHKVEGKRRERGKSSKVGPPLNARDIKKRYTAERPSITNMLLFLASYFQIILNPSCNSCVV